ncbi:MAG: alpha/beta hydrolase [Zoogloea sp.]|uniref:alpha/beta hydrolase n=1 Tax=Zoogloea sp. TaxID=49181 RepID=UPI003F41796A
MQTFPWHITLLALALSACGSADHHASSTPHGQWLDAAPQQVASLDNASIRQNWPALVELTDGGNCGVVVYHFRYSTTGARGEATEASAALMLPQGSPAECSGPRPLLLYAHGTSTEQKFNMAAVTDPNAPGYGDGLLVMSAWASRGYAVIAPNYAGYDSSPLPYHPYHIAEQQAGDMLDALQAGHQLLSRLGRSTGPQLFVTGHSQGGYVALATQRALEAQGIPLSASAPSSGAYALADTLDTSFMGRVGHGATAYSTMLIQAFQAAYGDVYARPTDIFAPAFASIRLPGAEDLEQVVARGAFPATALFDSTPPQDPAHPALQSTLAAATQPYPADPPFDALYAQGFGPTPLIPNPARLAVMQDVLLQGPDAPARHPLRQAARRNDLRTWTPSRPVLLCGGHADPDVFYDVNTLALQRYWQNRAPAGRVEVLDVDQSTPDSPYAGAQGLFDALRSQVLANSNGDATPLATLYHGLLVDLACTRAAQTFFARQQP